MSKLSSATQINPQDLFVTTTVAQTDLGTLAQTPDGRKFRYAKAGGTALVAGTLQQSPAETTGWQNLTPAAAAIGDKSITFTSTITAAANELAGGYALVTVTPGVGYVYNISSNAAYSAAAPTINLTDPIVVALTAANSKVDLVANPYSGVIINPASTSGVPVGVAMVAAVASTYTWIQTAGIANVLNDGGTTVGLAVCASNGTAGAVETLAGTQAPVGIAVTGISTTEYGAIRLLLD